MNWRKVCDKFDLGFGELFVLDCCYVPHRVTERRGYEYYDIECGWTKCSDVELMNLLDKTDTVVKNFQIETGKPCKYLKPYGIGCGGSDCAYPCSQCDFQGSIACDDCVCSKIYWTKIGTSL